MSKRIVRWLFRLGLGGAVAVMLLALGAAAYHAFATHRLERCHPPPGRLVDVGGHRLHLQVRGDGSPTVVFDAGLSGASHDWAGVAADIAKFTQVVTCDRAGYGWSDADAHQKQPCHLR